MNNRELYIELVDDDSPTGNNELIDRFVVPITGDSERITYPGIFGLAEIELSILIDVYFVPEESKGETDRQTTDKFAQSARSDGLFQSEVINDGSISGSTKHEASLAISTNTEVTLNMSTIRGSSDQNPNILIPSVASVGVALTVLLVLAVLTILMFLCYKYFIKNKERNVDKWDHSTYESVTSQHIPSFPKKTSYEDITAVDTQVSSSRRCEETCQLSQIYQVIEQDNQDDNQDKLSRLYCSIDEDGDYDYAAEYWTPSSVEEDLIVELMKLRIKIIPSTYLR